MRITDRKPQDIVNVYTCENVCKITIQSASHESVTISLDDKELIRLIEVLNEALDKI